MRTRLRILAGSCIFLSALDASAAGSDEEGPNIPLSVPPGMPVRVYLTKRVSSHVGAPVEGKIIESIFAFDREVMPAGSVSSSSTVATMSPLFGSSAVRVPIGRL